MTKEQAINQIKELRDSRNEMANEIYGDLRELIAKNPSAGIHYNQKWKKYDILRSSVATIDLILQMLEKVDD